MRRLPILGAALITGAVVLGLASPTFARSSAPLQGETTTTAGAATSAATDAEADAGRVSILKVEGLIDPVMADFIDRSIRDAEAARAVAVVLQMDSADAVVSDERLVELARRIHEADVPVTVWIGPSGSSALGKAAQLVGSAARVGIAPGARLGRTGALVVPDDLLAPAFVEAAGGLETRTVGAEAAHEVGITQTEEAPVIGEFLIGLPGVETKEVTEGAKTKLQPLTTPVFSALPVQDQLFHTVASPPAAYLLFVIGLSLIVFEFFTAGVGVAGLIGAGSLVLSCYGLAVLPTRPWAIALLVLAMFGFAVDVQTGVPRAWSVIGFVSLVVGSIALYDGFSLSWITLLVGIGGTASAMVSGMPAMVRTRFSTPTIGREWMIGEEGEAVTNVDPDGVVRIRGALWRARTNRATPIDLRDGVRVVEVDGLLLEVEPLEGGAVDYRERRGGSDAPASPADGEAVLVDGKPLDRS